MIDLEIVDLAYGGDGVGRHHGQVVFVPFVIAGETVRVRIRHVGKKLCRGDVAEVLVASEHRTDPRCKLYGRCGGCQLQHMAYPEQLRAKTDQVRQALQRIGGVTDIGVVRDTVPSPRPYNYRNKITLHNPAAPGFFSVNNRTVLEVSECPIAAKELNDLLKELPADLTFAKDLTLRTNSAGRTWMYDTSYTGKSTIPEEVAGVRYRTPLPSFFQVNIPVLEAVLAHVREQLTTLKPALLLDMYCGSGVLGLACSDLVKKVVGIEADAAAIRAARHTATALEKKNCSFYRGMAEGLIARELGQHEAGAGDVCVILDPPRNGCSPKMIAQLSKLEPAQLLYISCNPPAFARDLKKLNEAGYTCTDITPFDMFPQTGHVELVATLTR